MKQILKIEIKKALTNKFFLITLLFATAVALLSAAYMVDNYAYEKEMNAMVEDFGGKQINPELPAATLFNHWIGGEKISLMFSVFFTLIPLFAAVPYGWSYFMERKRGYVRNVVTRTSRTAYFFSKYLAVFLAGGLAVLIPLALNIMTVAMFVPAITPDVSYDLYLSKPVLDLWSGLFYTHPLICMGLYLLLDFVFAGLIATISLFVTFLVNNRFAVVLFPFLFLLLLHYSMNFFSNYELSPLFFLHASTIRKITRGWVIALEGTLFFAVPFAACMGWGRQRDVF